VGERDSDYVTAMADWELAEYRKSLEDALAQAEVPKYYLPREQLQEQLPTVLAEQDARRGG
jgi:hypothetical protein